MYSQFKWDKEKRTEANRLLEPAYDQILFIYLLTYLFIYLCICLLIYFFIYNIFNYAVSNSD
jgi:hypothetical protein